MLLLSHGNDPILDIVECDTEMDRCEQICQNTNGSYTCACETGFRLKSDGLQCEGMIRNSDI